MPWENLYGAAGRIIAGRGIGRKPDRSSAADRLPESAGRRTGWGGRIRTSEWRNQNSLEQFDLTRLFSRPRRKALLIHQKVSSKFPTMERLALLRLRQCFSRAGGQGF